MYPTMKISAALLAMSAICSFAAPAPALPAQQRELNDRQQQTQEKQQQKQLHGQPAAPVLPTPMQQTQKQLKRENEIQREEVRGSLPQGQALERRQEQKRDAAQEKMNLSAPQTPVQKKKSAAGSYLYTTSAAENYRPAQTTIRLHLRKDRIFLDQREVGGHECEQRLKMFSTDRPLPLIQLTAAPDVPQDQLKLVRTKLQGYKFPVKEMGIVEENAAPRRQALPARPEPQSFDQKMMRGMEKIFRLNL